MFCRGLLTPPSVPGRCGDSYTWEKFLRKRRIPVHKGLLQTTPWVSSLDRSDLSTGHPKLFTLTDWRSDTLHCGASESNTFQVFLSDQKCVDPLSRQTTDHCTFVTYKPTKVRFYTSLPSTPLVLHLDRRSLRNDFLTTTEVRDTSLRKQEKHQFWNFKNYHFVKPGRDGTLSWVEIPSLRTSSCILLWQGFGFWLPSVFLPRTLIQL